MPSDSPSATPTIYPELTSEQKRQISTHTEAINRIANPEKGTRFGIYVGVLPAGALTGVIPAAHWTNIATHASARDFLHHLTMMEHSNAEAQGELNFDGQASPPVTPQVQ